MAEKESPFAITAKIEGLSNGKYGFTKDEKKAKKFINKMVEKENLAAIMAKIDMAQLTVENLTITLLL